MLIGSTVPPSRNHPPALSTISVAIFQYGGGRSPYPRWLAYVNLWAAVSYMPGGVILFPKQGPFAWDGLLGLYLPFAGFFIWLLLMSGYTMKCAVQNVRSVLHSDINGSADVSAHNVKPFSCRA